MKKLDLRGQRFSLLVAVEPAAGNQWKCICDCGNVAYATASALRGQLVKSCGCLKNRYRSKGPRYPTASILPEQFEDDPVRRDALLSMLVALRTLGLQTVRGRKYRVINDSQTPDAAGRPKEYGPFDTNIEAIIHALTYLVRRPDSVVRRNQLRRDGYQEKLDRAQAAEQARQDREAERIQKQVRREERQAVARQGKLAKAGITMPEPELDEFGVPKNYKPQKANVDPDFLKALLGPIGKR